VVSQKAGEIAVQLPHVASAVQCILWRDSGDGGQMGSTRLPCNTTHTDTNLLVDKNYRYQVSGVGSDGSEGPRGKIVTFFSAGVPVFTAQQQPQVFKVGGFAIRIQWGDVGDGGSPIVGYRVEKDAGLLGQWLTVCDHSRQPTSRACIAGGLDTATKYGFRVFAVNRVGESAPAGVEYRIADTMATTKARPELLPSEIKANTENELVIQSVDPISGADERSGGRSFLLSVSEGVCQLDATGALCVPVGESHPDYVANPGKPICCLSSEDKNDGKYQITLKLGKVGKYSALLEATEAGGLLGQYWDNQWFYGDPVESRQDPDLDFNWGTGVITGQASDFVSVRWTGFVVADYDEEYTFLCARRRFGKALGGRRTALRQVARVLPGVPRVRAAPGREVRAGAA
jgi:hypothetical protein